MRATSIVGTSCVAASTHLLWFRPLSPLSYSLPSVLQAQCWGRLTHLPLDVLTPLPLKLEGFECLQASEAWFLTSPTAAYCLVQALNGPARLLTPRTLAFVGQASLDAWRAAGGSHAQNVVLSTTGESMGLLNALSQYRSVCVLRAQMGREDLPQALQARGVHVDTLAIYQKTPNTDFASSLNAALKGRTLPGTALCFTSTDQVARVLQATDHQNALLQASVWVNHPRVQAAASAAGFARVRLFA